MRECPGMGCNCIQKIWHIEELFHILQGYESADHHRERHGYIFAILLTLDCLKLQLKGLRKESHVKD